MQYLRPSLLGRITPRVALGVMLASLIATDSSALPVDGDAAFTKAASQAVDTVAREDGFSGVILVARGNQVLLRRGVGLADRKRNIAITPETKFPLESVTKQFTATAIMVLVEDGKISLSDPISKYYPASPPAWKDVTIKHLLTHGSGIEDYWIRHPEARIYLNTGDLLQSSGELIELAATDPLAFTPGANFEYSNTGYLLLTEVIERVSGQHYENFLRDHIFAKLGMHDTGYGVIPGHAVRGYSRSLDGEWHDGGPPRPAAGRALIDALTVIRNSGSHLKVSNGDGGLYSTLDDMLIWSRAQEGDKILSAASRKAMFTDYVFNYGFGWRFAPKFGQQLIWHTGNDLSAGFAAFIDRFPDEHLTVVVMTNNVGLTASTATLVIGGKETTYPASAARKLVEQVERFYFGKTP
jgi:D-alanyl-D-alanine carboxypeptidase